MQPKTRPSSSSSLRDQGLPITISLPTKKPSFQLCQSVTPCYSLHLHCHPHRWSVGGCQPFTAGQNDVCGCRSPVKPSISSSAILQHCYCSPTFVVVVVSFTDVVSFGTNIFCFCVVLQHFLSTLNSIWFVVIHSLCFGFRLTFQRRINTDEI